MILEKVQRSARIASAKEKSILVGLEGYYEEKYSFGYLADKLKIPLRAMIEFMEKESLPYYSASADKKRGLKRISRIRLAASKLNL